MITDLQKVSFVRVAHKFADTLFDTEFAFCTQMEYLGETSHWKLTIFRNGKKHVVKFSCIGNLVTAETDGWIYTFGFDPITEAAFQDDVAEERLPEIHKLPNGDILTTVKLNDEQCEATVFTFRELAEGITKVNCITSIVNYSDLIDPYDSCCGIAIIPILLFPHIITTRNGFYNIRDVVNIWHEDRQIVTYNIDSIPYVATFNRCDSEFTAVRIVCNNQTIRRFKLTREIGDSNHFSIFGNTEFSNDIGSYNISFKRNKIGYSGAKGVGLFENTFTVDCNLDDTIAVIGEHVYTCVPSENHWSGGDEKA